MTMEKSLLKWYNFNKRDLPWRKNTDAYRIWVSEIILQQTKISNGKKYFINFIDKFPTINHLAEATEEQVLKKWEGLGYYNRAINLHKTSKSIVKNLVVRTSITRLISLLTVLVSLPTILISLLTLATLVMQFTTLL